VRFGVSLVLASAGCRQIVGFYDEPGLEPAEAGADASSEAAGADASSEAEAGAAASSEAGGYRSTIGRWAFVDPGCGACIDRSCSETAAPCAGDPSCHAYEACVAGCRDKPCVSQCLSRVPSAILSPEVRPLLHCVAASCRTACPLSVLSLPNGDTCGPVFNKLECTSCCCPEFRACDDDQNCVRQSACARQCDGPPSQFQFCFEACTGRHPDPVTPTVSIGTCAEGPCQTSCGGEDWRCLGLVWPPQASPVPRKLYGSVLRRVDSVALGGFRVKMCSLLGAVGVPLDASATSGLDLCPVALDEAVSDVAGNVLLDLNKSSGLNKSSELSTYFEVIPPPGQDYPKTHFFLAGWTLTHSRHYDFYLAARNSLYSLPPSAPGLGSVSFHTYDCRQVLNPVPGVVVRAYPAGSDPVYLAPGFVPDPSATSTSPLGIGFITNLPAGKVVTLSASRHEEKDLIGTTPIVIQPDTETFVELVPTPQG
jgi:hypothetical protein